MSLDTERLEGFFDVPRLAEPQQHRPCDVDQGFAARVRRRERRPRRLGPAQQHPRSDGRHARERRLARRGRSRADHRSGSHTRRTNACSTRSSTTARMSSSPATPTAARCGCPAIGALVTNCDLPRDQASGLSLWHHARNTAYLNVSAGLGTSHLRAGALRLPARSGTGDIHGQRIRLFLIRLRTNREVRPETIGVWRSLVARFVRDEEVAGSNPVTPTTIKSGADQRFFHRPAPLLLSGCSEPPHC